jgi:hypothetical protein
VRSTQYKFKLWLKLSLGYGKWQIWLISVNLVIENTSVTAELQPYYLYLPVVATVVEKTYGDF